jgi:hypothetical protein
VEGWAFCRKGEALLLWEFGTVVLVMNLEKERSLRYKLQHFMQTKSSLKHTGLLRTNHRSLEIRQPEDH